MENIMEICKDTLKVISYDQANEVSMVNSDIEMYNFDKVQDIYFKNYDKQVLASIDGLCQYKGHWYFIEFKNGKMDKKSKDSIKAKVPASLLTFFDLIKMPVNEGRNKIDFVLVYNSESNPTPWMNIASDEVQNSESRNFIKRFIMGKAKENIILFGMNKYKAVYFKDIHTISKEEFACLLT